jgi:hypothetical protein
MDVSSQQVTQEPPAAQASVIPGPAHISSFIEEPKPSAESAETLETKTEEHSGQHIEESIPLEIGGFEPVEVSHMSEQEAQPAVDDNSKATLDVQSKVDDISVAQELVPVPEEMLPLL